MIETIDRPGYDTELRRAAGERNLDLFDPKNAYTVWAVFNGGYQFCGNCSTEMDARSLAAEHQHIPEMFILPADPMHFAFKVTAEGDTTR